MNHSASTKSTITFIIFIFLLWVPFTCTASQGKNTTADKLPIKIANSDFESIPDQGGLPVYWQRVTDRPLMNGSPRHPHPILPESQLPIITGEKNKGRQSSCCLRFEHPVATSSTVISQPLSLKVGHLYRLSGWIQTENATTDPIYRYPTPVAACLTMASFPFTNHSQALGGNSNWQEVAVLFIATQPQDQVRLHLGFNGPAKGVARFDDISLEEVTDVSAYIPMESVRWFGPAYRYDDKGWIFVHIQGKPYERGYQYGYLLAEDIAAYIAKLAYEEDKDEPQRGWDQLRRLTDTVFLRQFDPEYLEEMKGIADGAAKNGAEFDDEPIDFIDIVTLNSVIDIGQLNSALRRTGHALSGCSFLKAEEELDIPLKQHKCSGFTCTGPATANGEIVFGQIFMWGGYTGVHWNVICDIKPEKGYRLVYETFPGGIHSGADIYVNGAGIMIGETTVSQTPYEIDSTPQSNRIRKAAQYGGSIDEVVKILEFKNNGMYTNDWLLGDAKTNEVGILLLGTHKSKLWRSSTGIFPGNTKGFYWSNNNNKDPEVRKEYIHNTDNAPYDLIFTPWNRDIAFYDFYQQYKGKIDAIAGVDLWASSPINRAHACDGKITTSAMAKNLMFLAHFGKVTLREKFPHKNNRMLRDYPNATPHLSLGYSVVAPKWITEKLQLLKQQQDEKEKRKGIVPANGIKKDKKKEYNIQQAPGVFSFDSRYLWHNTVYPKSSHENWFVSGTAAYWNILDKLAEKEKEAEAITYLSESLAALNNQLLYTISREGAVVPTQVERRYDRYGDYRIPRIRGTYALHQLRLYLGNQLFAKVMNHIHDRYREKPMTTANMIAAVEKISKRPVKDFIMQWINRSDQPQATIKLTKNSRTGEKWNIRLLVEQPASHPAYHFFTTIAVKSANSTSYHKVEISSKSQEVVLEGTGNPRSVIFNAGYDVPLQNENFYTWSNFYDDFQHTLIVYGTNRQDEANHTLAQRFQTRVADRYSEILPPLRKDSEISAAELAQHDLIVIGGVADNSLVNRIIKKTTLDLVCGKNYFTWQGKTYGQWDDGLFVVLPNPFNPAKVVYLVIANSALQLYHMTNQVPRLPSWAVFKKDEISEKGNHYAKEWVQLIR